jgi:hypothetical protein
MQARTQSNFTYADADGNIFYVWNAMHPTGPTRSARTPWRTGPRGRRHLAGAPPLRRAPPAAESPGGYLRNENDPFHHTNLNAVLDAADYPPRPRRPGCGSGASTPSSSCTTTVGFSLEDVVALRGSERMLLADRVLDDLLAALGEAGAAGPRWSAGARCRARLLERWDRTVAAGARGRALHRVVGSLPGGAGRAPSRAANRWAFRRRAERLFAEPWRWTRPMTTPRGLARRGPGGGGLLGGGAATRDTVGIGGRGLGGHAPGPARHAGPPGERVRRTPRVLPGHLVQRRRRRPPKGARGRRLGVRGGVRSGAPGLHRARLRAEQPPEPVAPGPARRLRRHRMTPVAWTWTDIAASVVRYRPGAPVTNRTS